MKRILLCTASIIFLYTTSSAQENYEIQIYASETMAPGMTIVELHSNYTPYGQLLTGEVRPTHHAWHETIEITHGFNDWFETGFYIFTNIHPEYGWQYVGNHLRPRVRVPESWKWPVGISLSTEIGYQRREYAEDTWNIEIRPIIDKDFKWIYLSLNPTLGKSFEGLNEDEGFDFDPGFKMAIHASKKIDIGTEYYASTGILFEAPQFKQQEHMIYAIVDLFFSEEWEFNAGMGWGLTSATDGQVIKLILGRRFGGKKKE